MKKLIVLLIFPLFLFSCATKIADLKSNPEKYAGQIVKVKGNVNKLIKIPFTDYRFIELGDDTDNIIVFTVKEHKKNEIVTMEAKVVAYDSTNQKESSVEIIDAIEEFILNTVKIDEKKVKKTAETIASAITTALNKSSATYFLIEQE